MPNNAPFINRRRAAAVALFLAAGVSLCAAPAPASQRQREKKAAAPAPRKDAFLTGRPFTLEDILGLLDALREGSIGKPRLADAIRNRKADFELTEENVKRLEAKDPPADLMELIRKVARVPARKAEPSGSVEVSCVPAECEVRVNDGAFASTEHGVWRSGKLRLGEAAIDVRKPGYIGTQRVVTLTPAPVAVKFELEPDAATKAAFGKQLFAAMLQALGAPNGKYRLDVTGKGGASVWDTAGKRSEWDVAFMVAAQPPLSDFELRGAPGVFALLCRGENCEAKGGRIFRGKQLKGPEAGELETVLRVLRRSLLPNMIARMQDPGMRAAANTALAAGAREQQLRIEGHDEAYAVTLSPDLLPAGVVYQTKTGLGSGLQTTYADYVAVGAMKYPRRTQIKLADAREHGILVRLDQASAGAQMREKDFPR